MIKTARKSNREFSKETMESLSAYLEMSEEEIMERLEKPWGLKQQLLMGKWPNHRQEREQIEAEIRLRVALKLINLLESGAVPPQAILRHLLRMRTEVEKLHSCRS